MFHREGAFFFFSNRMPPAVGVNVVLEGQRCAHELILGMSRRAWRQRSRVQRRWWGRGGSFGKWVLECRCTVNEKLNTVSAQEKPRMIDR